MYERGHNFYNVSLDALLLLIYFILNFITDAHTSIVDIVIVVIN
jgi:hypothetical protein